MRAVAFARDREVDRIRHNEPDFSISETVGRADVIYTLTYRTDGQEPKPALELNGVKRTAHWEGKTLVLDTRFVGGKDLTEKREELSLSDNGKTFTKRVHYIGARPKPDQNIEFKKLSAGIRGIFIADSEAVVRHEWGDPDSVQVPTRQTIFRFLRRGFGRAGDSQPSAA